MSTGSRHIRQRQARPPVTVVVTVKNEAATIVSLLEALRMQTVQPSQVIISDGGSTDATFAMMSEYAEKHPTFPLKIIEALGNRSVGRNAAIRAAKTDLIAITDAGCIPEPQWIEELLDECSRTGADLTAGYYQGAPQTAFETAQVPFVLVLPRNINPRDFLPATRSVMLKKSAWEKIGGFDEKLALNEDYAFSLKARALRCTFAFARHAVVSWRPRATLGQFFKMLKAFAQGDIEAGIVRPKVILVFLRYLLGLSLVAGVVSSWGFVAGLLFAVSGLLLYAGWAVLKHFADIQRGWHWLPVLQITADAAVILGSLGGYLSRLRNTKL